MKPIPNFKGYFINKNGNIYSIIKRSNQSSPKKPKLLKVFLSAGYKTIFLTKDKERYKRFIHRLLLEIFIGKCPKGMECRHLNGNRLDNRLSNLKWGTRRENQRDRLFNNKDNRGEKSSLSKLTKKQVLEIRILAKKNNKKIRKSDNGGNYKEIAKKYNISPSNVGAIIRRLSWAWLD